MYALVVNLECKPGMEEAFHTAAMDDASNSVKEPGCLRFDVYRDHEDQKHLIFIEVYQDEHAFKAHTQTEHFARWGEATKDIRKTISAVRCTNLFPSDSEWE